MAEEIKYHFYSNRPVAIALGARQRPRMFAPRGSTRLPLSRRVPRMVRCEPPRRDSSKRCSNPSFRSPPYSRIPAWSLRSITPGDPRQRLGSHTVDFACKFESYGNLVGRIERVKVNLMTAEHTHFGPIRGGLS